MTRHTLISSDEIEDARDNIGRTTVMLVGISQYEELEGLKGPPIDMEMMNDLFGGENGYSCYRGRQLINIEQPTCRVLNDEIVRYSKGRTGIGDILILYFTGHGCILSNRKFGFCCSDTKLGRENRSVLPLSVVCIDDVLATLCSYQVYPLFIIDACFSQATAPNGLSGIDSTIEQSMKSYSSDTFGVITSCSSIPDAYDTEEGGMFSIGFYQTMTIGLADGINKRSPFIDLHNISNPLKRYFEKVGFPLPNISIGKDFPNIPLSKNIAFRPQIEKFTKYFKKIVEYLWNNGDPIESSIDALLKNIGPAAYANHSKLSYSPWGLVEDSERKKYRRLTNQGKQFAQGLFAIPKQIFKDTSDMQWKSDNETEYVTINEI